MKNFFRVIIAIIIGTTLFLFSFLGYYFWDLDSQGDKILESENEFSCRNTGGKWQIDSCGSACWEGYPKSKSERIKNEMILHKPIKTCIMVCSMVQYCTCPEGQYFGSSEEGCIPESEKAEPDKKEVEVIRKAEEAAKQDLLLRRIEEYKSDGEYSWKNLDGIKFLYSNSNKSRYFGAMLCTSTGCTCPSYTGCISQFNSDSLEKISSKNVPKPGQMPFPLVEIILDSEGSIENPKEAITQIINGDYKDTCEIEPYYEYPETDTLSGGFASNQNYEFYMVHFKSNDYTRNSDYKCSTLIASDRGYREDEIGRIISRVPLQYFMYSKKSKRLLFINQSDDPFVIDPSSVEF